MALPAPERPLPDSAETHERAVVAPLLFAVFVRALPLTMFGPLLVGIAASLGAGLAQVGWIVATYATGSLVAQPLAGRLADRRGRRAVLLWCLVAFGAGSAVCALSTSLVPLVIGRVVQALGAGGIQPVATALIGQRVQEDRRGRALGALYAMFGLGTMAGALLGGGIVTLARRSGAALAAGTGLRAELTSYPWHFVFWLNVALAAVAFVQCVRLPSDGVRRTGSRLELDVIAMLLVVAFTGCAMAAATAPPPFSLAAIAGAAACVLGLAVWERRATAPLFDPVLFDDKPTAAIALVAFIFGVPSFTLTIYSATYLIARFGVDEAKSGLALFGLAVCYVVGAIAGGRAVKRFGARDPLVIGIVLAGVALAGAAAANDLMGASIAMSLGGLGLGLASAPPNALVLALLPESRAGAATGLLTMLATSGAITAPAAISGFIHASASTAASAMRADFVAGAVACAVCAAIALRLPRR